MNRYEDLIQHCDALIRSGEAHSVAKRLGDLNLSRVPRVHRLPLAKVCRRSGLYTLGLKLLTKLVLNGEATPAELAEHAVLLLRVGALSEALDKLRQVDVAQAPDALLYLAFSHFLRWEYAEAIPYLEAYLRTDLPAYARIVGQTNLAFALVETGQHEAAETVLADTLRVARSENHQQIQSNCHALRTQLLAQQANYKGAREELELAKSFVPQAQTNDQIFARKWGLILDGLESRNAEPFHRLRELALQTRNGEMQREADLYALRFDMVRERFVHLYFGTPFARFRERIVQELGPAPEQPIYVYGKKSSPRFDLRSGEINGVPALNPGGKCHQMLEVLLRDFYQPLRIGGMFSLLFPREQFNILSSPDRVHQILRRTRGWIAREKIPIEITESEGFFKLEITGPFSFRVPLERGAIDHQNVHFLKLKARYPARPFSVRQAREDLNLSTATVHRLIHWAMGEGLLERHGEADRTTLFKILELKSA